MPSKRVAVIGGGVSGLVAAHALSDRHDVALYEAADYLGGHTNTITVERDSGTWHLDTGFLVLNDRNYPRFRELLAAAGVATQRSHMGFSVKGEDEDFEYAGTPRGVFAQRENLARPAFWRMLADLLRFNRALAALLEQDAADDRSLAEFVSDGGYSRWFAERLIVPQVSAVWSADPAQMWAFPVRFLAEFFANHGMLGFRDRPRWLTVSGGSHRYVQALSRPLAGRIHLRTPVRSLRRDSDSVTLRLDGGRSERFDEVVVACHADQALALLEDPSAAERELLSSFPYKSNEAVLHTDAALLPRRLAARQAWNYHLFAKPRPATTVTYYLNHLQRLRAPEHFCVTLNLAERIDERKVIRTLSYAHPIYTAAAIAAQARVREISPARRTRYCGAYWGWGFHEDGVVSALRAVEDLR
ncbi:MAG TPA: FAD-dependent oxidoreductase [Solirubrobacteraceae bacterium]|nr:FAD-dependent oxidoreductase [Solirubrobacteraceae bacterium]